MERQANSTTMHKYETTMLFSSEDADFVTDKGSRFSVNFSGDKLNVPKNAENIHILVQSAQIWNTVPNIGDDNNVLSFNIDGTNYNLEIPKGLYSRSELNTVVLRLLQNEGLFINNEAPFQFLEDVSTNKVVLLINRTGVTIDFTAPRNFAEIVGFQDTIVLPEVTVPVNIFAPNVAKFNQVEFFLIGSDLCSRGIRINKRFANVICQVPIDVEPGSNIVYEPRNPSIIDCSNLRGNIRDQVSFFLTDQNLKPVDTNGEFFSVRLNLTYYA